jgi:hypothetical protein
VALLNPSLLARGRNVNVNLLGSATSKQTASKGKEHYQNNDHKDHEHRHNARTSAAIIVSHEGVPPLEPSSFIVGAIYGEAIVITRQSHRQTVARGAL